MRKNLGCNMKKIIFGLLVAILLIGCSSKELHIFAEDKPYVEAMRYTKKGDILLSLENRALIIATYLNPLQKKRDKEYFFVRVYIDNDFEDENRSGLFNPNYSLTLNDQKPLKIIKVSRDSNLAKKMPFIEPWYHLYVVTFKKSTQKQLKLIFQNDVAGKALLVFQNYQAD